MPRSIASLLQRDVPLLHAEMPVGEAVQTVVDADLPALPVVNTDERYAGIFGEREFITATRSRSAARAAPSPSPNT